MFQVSNHLIERRKSSWDLLNKHLKSNRKLKVLWDSSIIWFWRILHMFYFSPSKGRRANKTKLKSVKNHQKSIHASIPVASEPQHATVSHFGIWLWGTWKKSRLLPSLQSNGPLPWNHGSLRVALNPQIPPPQENKVLVRPFFGEMMVLHNPLPEGAGIGIPLKSHDWIPSPPGFPDKGPSWSIQIQNFQTLREFSTMVLLWWIKMRFGKSNCSHVWFKVEFAPVFEYSCWENMLWTCPEDSKLKETRLFIAFSSGN